LLEEEFSKDNEDSEENLYEIRIIRNRSGSVVDFEYYFTVNPVYFYYRALLIKIIKSFTTLGTKSSEELKLNAWDKFQNIKDNTSEKIKSALLQTTNILNGSILNPKIILPFTQNNDVKSPAYVFCLGDLRMCANKENLDEPLYKYMNASISGIQFQYFETLLLWEKFERDADRETLKKSEFFKCINKSVFNVIEELEINFKLGQRK